MKVVFDKVGDEAASPFEDHCEHYYDPELVPLHCSNSTRQCFVPHNVILSLCKLASLSEPSFGITKESFHIA